MAKKILIIEDDVFLGDVLLQKLKSAGYNASLARDGGEGLKIISTLMPDLILLDIILPTMNGYEILEAKSKDPAIKDIPVIIVSNSGQPVEIDRVLSFGVKDYLVKAQFDPEEVLTKVKNELNQIVKEKTESFSGSLLNGKKIMWVEDDKFLSDIISRKLSQEKCTLIHATDGEEVVGVAEKELPDIILLDILLPGIDGFEILSRLKANDKTKKIPVILLSNLGQQADIEKGKTLGSERFLIKATVTLDEIVAEVKSVLSPK